MSRSGAATASLTRGLRVGCLCIVVGVLASAGCGAQSEPVRVTFLDVGQGDAVVVQAPEGQTALIDAGPPGVDVVSKLRGLGVRQLDLVVATHPHADHIGGMLDVIRSIPVRFYMDNGEPYTTATYMELMRELRSRPEITYLEATPRTLELGSVQLEVLMLPQTPAENPNNRSVGLIVTRGAFRAFLSGDSEMDELVHFMHLERDLDVTLLKAPHHGSDDALSELFLEFTRPAVVVISVGEGNSYGHPHPAALFSYTRYADEVFRTDRDGRVTVSGFEDGSYGVTVGQDHGPATPVASESELSLTVEPRGVAEPGGLGEYAAVTNESARAVTLSGWMLCDAARHCFTFPRDTVLPAGDIALVYTGVHYGHGLRFFMGSETPVWNDAGDTATLYDETGAVVAQHVY